MQLLQIIRIGKAVLILSNNTVKRIYGGKQ